MVQNVNPLKKQAVLILYSQGSNLDGIAYVLGLEKSTVLEIVRHRGY